MLIQQLVVPYEPIWPLSEARYRKGARQTERETDRQTDVQAAIPSRCLYVQLRQLSRRQLLSVSATVVMRAHTLGCVSVCVCVCHVSVLWVNESNWRNFNNLVLSCIICQIVEYTCLIMKIIINIC